MLVALKRDGRPQLSNITYTLGGDGIVRISITADRAKFANLQRSLYRDAVGEHPEWNEYRAVMVSDRRLVVRLHPVHAYGMNAE